MSIQPSWLFWWGGFDVLKAERPDSLDVLWADRQAYLLQLLQRSFDVARVPENDGIDDKTQRPKLVLLSFTVALAQFTALAVEDGTGKTMTAFTAVELGCGGDRLRRQRTPAQKES